LLKKRESLIQKEYLTIFIVLFLGLIILYSCSSRRNTEVHNERASQIHESVLTVDTHADTPTLMLNKNWDMAKRHEVSQGSGEKIDLPRMKEGGLDAEFFAVFVGQGPLTFDGYEGARNKAANMLKLIHHMCSDYPELVELATSPDDAYRLERLGKRAAFISMENGYPIGRDLSLIKEFYQKGVRMITLCHSADNDICDSSTDRLHPEDRGLSDFGKEVIEECNRLGIIIDISHISDKSFFDVLEVTRAPVVASHSSVRALCDNPRNMSDKMLRALKENGGVIQICFYTEFIKIPKPNPKRENAMEELTRKYGSWSDVMDDKTRELRAKEYEKIMNKYPIEMATLDDLVDHIDYVVNLIGINHVGIGTDFDGGGGVIGCNDVTEMPHITEELLQRGYSEQDIRKIWGGNLMRVFNEVIETADAWENE
jgi:membrane dipeptidase